MAINLNIFKRKPKKSLTEVEDLKERISKLSYNDLKEIVAHSNKLQNELHNWLKNHVRY